MGKKSSFFVLMGYIYMTLPILLFFIGWCNLPTAIIGAVTIVISSYFLFKNSPKLWFPNSKKEWGLIASMSLICFIWVYSSGIGAFVFQNSDHTARNAIFEYLITRPWPVNDGNVMLSYYIGFWLPAAAIGKICNSIQIGYLFQLLWAFLGIFLTMYYVLSGLKKKSVIPILIFILFSGLDAIGGVIFRGSEFSLLHYTKHLEWWFPGFQFSSITTQLYWVFNQAIPAWIITMILYNEKNNKSIIFIYSCMFLCATLPAIGMLPFMLWWGIKNGEENVKNIFTKSHWINIIKSAISIPNILGGGIVTVVCHSYLSGNMSGAVSYLQLFPLGFLIIWFVLFFMLECGLYFLCLANIQKKNPLFYICLFCMLFYPFIHIGYAADFCMRATIPALFLLYLFIIQAFDSEEFCKKKFCSSALIIFLVIGSITPLHEITRTVKNTANGITKAEPVLEGANFFAYVEGNKFLKYFGKIRN